MNRRIPVHNTLVLDEVFLVTSNDFVEKYPENYLRFAFRQQSRLLKAQTNSKHQRFESGNSIGAGVRRNFFFLQSVTSAPEGDPLTGAESI